MEISLGLKIRSNTGAKSFGNMAVKMKRNWCILYGDSIQSWIEITIRLNKQHCLLLAIDVLGNEMLHDKKWVEVICHVLILKWKNKFVLNGYHEFEHIFIKLVYFLLLEQNRFYTCFRITN